MGIESGDDDAVGGADDIAALSAELDTDSLTFVDSLNTEIADLVENTPTLEYDTLSGR